MPHDATLKPSILVVDDSDDGREMVVEYLVFRGFPVSSARDGAEAIEVAHRVRPHIVLMDLSMPGVDGWEAAQRLKSEPLTRHIIIIAFTAHAFPAEQEAARSAGCDAIIAKPCDLAQLADTLERMHGGRRVERKPAATAPSSHEPDAPLSKANDSRSGRREVGSRYRNRRR